MDGDVLTPVVACLALAAPRSPLRLAAARLAARVSEDDLDAKRSLAFSRAVVLETWKFSPSTLYSCWVEVWTIAMTVVRYKSRRRRAGAAGAVRVFPRSTSRARFAGRTRGRRRTWPMLSRI